MARYDGLFMFILFFYYHFLIFTYSQENDDAILVAANTGNLELLRELRNEASDDEAFRRKCENIAEIEGLTCLHFAAGRGDIEICRFLIEEVKLNIDFKTDKGDSPLILAALKGQFKAAKYLINRGADVKMGGYRGITCLHIAASNGNKEIMQLLLLKGADIEAHSVWGTPLQCAAACGDVESVRFLLSRGADPNAVSPLSVSSLMSAIKCRSFELLEMLLKAKADPNKMSCGLSPLAMAAKENDTRFLRLLLAAGANPNSPTSKLLLPIEYAAEVGNAEGLAILFPVTETASHSRYPDWSIRGIENRFHSESAKTQIKEMQDGLFRILDEQGKDAVNRKDHARAVEMFSEAIYLQPDNARLLSNRSLCWANLNEPHFALYDAEVSFTRRPDWPKAYYRAGAACMLLKNYHKACGLYQKASTLDPTNMQIKKALSLALKPAILFHAERDPLNMATYLALQVQICNNFYVNLRDLAKKDPMKAMKILRKFLDNKDLHHLL
ncbi:hypothetical protein CASFOL_008741 [Castilleja foliolosa]|uniref:Uncharacterized protein n=1 Tax=Castilleja foliolosa TaxID=1961234 RepID=A0ABD3DZU1_9LAMI